MLNLGLACEVLDTLHRCSAIPSTQHQASHGCSTLGFCWALEGEPSWGSPSERLGEDGRLACGRGNSP